MQVEESSPEPPSRPRRATCARCGRPVTVCYCAALTRIETRSKIVILQHPREEGMPIGTAHMAHLCLPQSEIHVGVRWDDSPVLASACADPERPPVLLYPGPGARDILAEPPPGPVTLIVVDGTWAHARTLVRDNPKLAALPRYAFSAPEPSNYRIRREPDVAYVSTLEALMHVLGAIEGEPERFRALMQPMNTMVDAQLAAQRAAQAAGQPPRKLKRRRAQEPYTHALKGMLERYEDIVLVYADANAWPWGTPERRFGDELVYWVALRPSTGETFARVVAPRNPLAPEIPAHTGLPAETLQAGGTVDAMLTAFSAFTRPTDVIGFWGFQGLRMFQDCGGTLDGTCVDLRARARVLANRKTGPLETYAADLPPAALEGTPRGRAGRRLALLAGVLANWRAQASEEAARAETLKP